MKVDHSPSSTGDRISFALGECAVGAILIARNERGVCEISLGDDPSTLSRDFLARHPDARPANDELLNEIKAVAQFIEQPASGLDLPLDIGGTPFQQRVWAAVRQIPAGATASYTEIARRVGAPQAVRAVASAIAANRLAVVIPCHRIVRSNGDLSGYRWGIARKAALLRCESQARTVTMTVSD